MDYVISKKKIAMELYVVNIIFEDQDPFDVVFSAKSFSDAKNIINEKYPNCKIISVKELYKQ